MAGKLALALSGGGARGAYQVGVLDELVRVRGVDFEIAAGTSTGAIQAAAVAQNDVERLVGFWEGITGNSSIYKGSDSLLSVGWALVRGKEGVLDPDPLKALLHEMYDDAKIRATGKSLRLSIVNIDTGELRYVAENADNIADWVYASSAQPPFFPPFASQMADGKVEKWVDGGVREVIPLEAALKERPRAVLVVRAEAPLAPSNKDFDDLVKIGLQSVELMTREVARSDIDDVGLMNLMLDAKAKQRHELEALSLTPDQIERAMEPFNAMIEQANFAPAMVLQPETELYERLEFDPVLIAENIERGRQTVRDKWSELAAFLGVPE